MARFVGSCSAAAVYGLGLVVALVLISSGLASAQNAQCTYRLYEANGALPCGNAVFYPPEQACCNGVVHNRNLPNAEPYRCCGTEWVPDDQCCGGNPIVPESPFDPVRCCRGVQTYDSLVSVCCADGTTLSTFDQEFACCHNLVTGENQLYNTTSQQCCAGNVLASPAAGTARLCCRTAFRTYDPFNETLACCETPTGSEIYDPTTSICCSSGVVAVTDTATAACCGDQTYNTTTQVCCGNSNSGSYAVYTERDNHVCCGTDYVNTELNVACCGNRLYPAFSGFIECCVDQVYNERKHMCVQDFCRYCPLLNPDCDSSVYGGMA
ncbi:hypothetical protein PTSG_13113 [Salpingoeca rosetta]|uniref:Galaxin-like repeats domain-containing protein n=1 Tax=Salpingoeca rosetta (strain ATCC 50818 / BSB-021) TaxID=946362 RepID=F2UR94_SALR5|nr:uncharacterized protein PTSG_13113 [Salpingoeca rosetta]EGD80197.1 hypothetical protein PTSG_13113 [Salpingoeca rosetta]|eukprot:XP_004988259.1 hypothetical protein PTSG_13113 [Salpingoeca rosetta]